MIELRRHFHRHPEVSFSEHETSKYLGERLQQLGLELKPCPTETGVVAILDTGRPGKTVMLRADIGGRGERGLEHEVPDPLFGCQRERERGAEWATSKHSCFHLSRIGTAEQTTVLRRISQDSQDRQRQLLGKSIKGAFQERP